MQLLSPHISTNTSKLHHKFISHKMNLPDGCRKKSILGIVCSFLAVNPKVINPKSFGDKIIPLTCSTLSHSRFI